MVDPFSAIVGVIDLLAKTKHTFDKFKDAKKLPEELRAIAGQISIAKGIFEEVKKTTQGQVIENGVRETAERCEEDTRTLNEIYELVIMHIHGDWLRRYKSYINNMREDRKGEVKTIWSRILNGSHLLAAHFNVQKLSEIKAKVDKAIEELSHLPDSLERDDSGSIWNNYAENKGFQGKNDGQVNFGGTNYSVAGNQTVNHNEVPKDTLKECMNALVITDPRDHLRVALERGQDGRSTREWSRDGRAPKTCDWVESDEAFLDWLQSPTPALLCILGEPGIGKTVLATHIVDKVLPSHLPSDDTLVYFFCNNNTADSQRNTAEAILRGLLWFLLEIKMKPKQTEKEMKQASDQASDFYTRYFEEEFRSKGASFFSGSHAEGTLWSIFHKVVRQWGTGQLWILIDAFDECEGDSRRSLVDELQKLLQDSKPFPLKIVLTSRTINHIEGLYEDCRWSKYKLDMTTAKVKQDLNNFIELEVGRLSTRKEWDYATKKEVLTKLKQENGGTFLWVSLAIDSLAEIRRKNVLVTLAKFPKQLVKVYQRILHEITENDQDDARLVLHLVLSAKVPMSFDTLALALYFHDAEQEASMPTEKDVKDQKEMINTCRMLLRLEGDPATNQVTIIHQSVKDFLTNGEGNDDWRYSVSVDDAQSVIMDISMAYFRTKEFLDVSTDAIRLYAAAEKQTNPEVSWPCISPQPPIHTSWAATSFTLALFHYLVKVNNLREVLSHSLCTGPTFTFLELVLQKVEPGHILWRLATLCLRKGYNATFLVMFEMSRDIRDHLREHHERMATIFLLLKASIVSGNSEAVATLIRIPWAISKLEQIRHSESINFFNQCVDVKYGMPPQFNMPATRDISLRLAALNELDSLPPGVFKRITPLHQIVQGGKLAVSHCAMVDGIDTGVSGRCRNIRIMEMRGIDTQITLFAAIKSTPIKFVEPLPDKAIEDVTPECKGGYLLPLCVATRLSEADFAEVLAAADQGRKSLWTTDRRDGMLPLHFAAKQKSLEAIEALVEADTQRRSLYKGNKAGMLPLHIAARHRSPETIAALIRADTDGRSLYAEDNAGMLPLHIAAKRPSTQAVRALIGAENQSWPFSVEGIGVGLPHHLVASSGSIESVRTLIKAHGEGTSLCAPTEMKRNSALHLDKTGNMPIHVALLKECWNKGTVAVMRELLLADDKKVSLHTKDNDGMLPLRRALWKCSLYDKYGIDFEPEEYDASLLPSCHYTEQILKTLLIIDAGKALSKEIFEGGMNAVHLAVSAGWSLDIIETMLKAESSLLNSKCNIDNLTPLDHAYRKLRDLDSLVASTPNPQPRLLQFWDHVAGIAVLLRDMKAEADSEYCIQCRCADRSPHECHCDNKPKHYKYCRLKVLREPGLVRRWFPPAFGVRSTSEAILDTSMSNEASSSEVVKDDSSDESWSVEWEVGSDSDDGSHSEAEV